MILRYTWIVVLPVILSFCCPLFAEESAATTDTQKPVITVLVGANTSSVEGEGITVYRTRKQADSFHLVLLNDRAEEQDAVLHFKELMDAEYDVYVNSKLIGLRSRGDLESGLSLSLRGCVRLEDQVIINRILDEANPLIQRFMAHKTPASDSVLAALANIRGWCNAASGRIRNSGSTYVVLNAADRALPTTVWEAPSAETVNQRTDQFWKAIMDQREILHSTTSDKALRDVSIAAITPVDIHAVEGGELNYKCTITNSSNVPLNGKLELVSASGDTVGNPVAFTDLAPGRSFDAATELPQAHQNSSDLRVRADVQVGKVRFARTVAVAECHEQ